MNKWWASAGLLALVLGLAIAIVPHGAERHHDSTPLVTSAKSDGGKGEFGSGRSSTGPTVEEALAAKYWAAEVPLRERLAQWQREEGRADWMPWSKYITTWADFAWESTEGLSREEMESLLWWIDAEQPETGCFYHAVLQRLASLNPEEALGDLIESRKDGGQEFPAEPARPLALLGFSDGYHDIMAGWARVDPEKAWRRYEADRGDLMMAEVLGGYRNITPFPIFREWARRDHERALTELWEEVSLDCFSAMQEGFFDSVPGRQDWRAIGEDLVGFFIEHEENGLTETGARPMVVRWLQEDPEAALTWLTRNVRDTLWVANEPVSLRGYVLAEWYNRDPVGAHAWVSGQARSGNEALTTAFLLHALTDLDRQESEHAALLGIVALLPGEEQRGAALRQVAAKATSIYDSNGEVEDEPEPLTGGGSSIHETRVLMGRIELWAEDRAAIQSILAARESDAAAIDDPFGE